MDPDACLVRLFDALAEGDREEAGAALIDLADWIAKGGFLPKDPRMKMAADDLQLLNDLNADVSDALECYHDGRMHPVHGKLRAMAEAIRNRIDDAERPAEGS